MARCQVTNADYAAFRKFEFAIPTLPVTSVSWFDAVAYLRLAGRRSGTCRCACRPRRSGSSRRAAGVAAPLSRGAMSCLRSQPDRWRDGPEPVGQGEPNGYGLFDMCQNVHEWCSDWYDAGLLRGIAGGESARAGAWRRAAHLEGGAWRHHIKVSRCAARSSIPPEFRYADYGFRVVVS